MAVAAIANEVHDDVTAKLRAILGSELSYPHDGVGILAVYVKDGNGLALGDVPRRTARNAPAQAA